VTLVGARACGSRCCCVPNANDFRRGVRPFGARVCVRRAVRRVSRGWRSSRVPSVRAL
jgi:hypothetical protein